MHAYLDFERAIADLEGKIVELRQLAAEDASVKIDDEVKRLQARADQHLRETYAKLTPWQKTQVARHPDRPRCHIPRCRQTVGLDLPAVREVARGEETTT